MPAAFAGQKRLLEVLELNPQVAMSGVVGPLGEQLVLLSAEPCLLSLNPSSPFRWLHDISVRKNSSC